MPERLQLSRKRGWRKPAGAIVVARPSYFGNPWRVGSLSAGRMVDAAEAVRLYRTIAQGDFLRRVRSELRGRDLCCWCALDKPCHADVLLDLANR